MTPSLKILVLGGTSWLGGAVAAAALSRGHQVICLARGRSGSVPAGATLVVADRAREDAYADVAETRWDAVVDVSWQPSFVGSALQSLAPSARMWLYVSSISVSADHTVVGADESAALVPAWQGEGTVGIQEYAGAKVSCETACREAVDGDHLQIARPGLIAGYGDRSDRFGYWPARLAAVREGDAVLVPPLHLPVQVIDVLDLARWLVGSAEQGTAGTFDLVGRQVAFADVLTACRTVTGRSPAIVEASEEWLVGAGVAEWGGASSLPLWLSGRHLGMVCRTGATARAWGLSTRPIISTAADALRWETERGLDRDRSAGLTRAREAELLGQLAGPLQGSS